jgi:hypothetical protein
MDESLVEICGSRRPTAGALISKSRRDDQMNDLKRYDTQETEELKSNEPIRILSSSITFEDSKSESPHGVFSQLVS